MARSDPDVIARCRSRYEASAASMKDIAAEFGINARTLSGYCRKQGWARPGSKPASRVRAPREAGAGARQARAQKPGLVARLWTAAERQMTEIEATLSGIGEGDGAAREREARLMALLVRVTAGLAALEAKPGKQQAGNAAGHPAGTDVHGAADHNGADRDIDEFRRELEARLARLRDERADEAFPGGSEPG